MFKSSHQQNIHVIKDRLVWGTRQPRDVWHFEQKLVQALVISLYCLFFNQQMINVVRSDGRRILMLRSTLRAIIEIIVCRKVHCAQSRIATANLNHSKLGTLVVYFHLFWHSSFLVHSAHWSDSTALHIWPYVLYGAIAVNLSWPPSCYLHVTIFR